MPQSTASAANAPKLSPEERILIEEVLHTNKSMAALRRDTELELMKEPPAPCLNGGKGASNCWVEVPEVATEFLSTATLPLSESDTRYVEALVARHNGVPAESIAADHLIITEGKTWKFFPESARVNTGFSYYPEE